MQTLTRASLAAGQARARHAAFTCCYSRAHDPIKDSSDECPGPGMTRGVPGGVCGRGAQNRFLVCLFQTLLGRRPRRISIQKGREPEVSKHALLVMATRMRVLVSLSPCLRERPQSLCPPYAIGCSAFCNSHVREELNKLKKEAKPIQPEGQGSKCSEHGA